MADPYQSLERLRERVEYEPTDIFPDDGNAAKRFDRLLMGTNAVDDAPSPEWGGLELEARKIIETRLGDEPLTEELGREDVLRPGYDAAQLLVYPIQSIGSVEYKRTLGGEWETLDPDYYTHTEHRLILEYGSRRGHPTHGTRRNTLADDATRATWRDLAAQLRVTYDRGFDPVPADILSVQVALVNRFLRNLKTEQNIAAMEPEQIAAVTSAEAVLTSDIEARIDQFTPLGGATMSV
jgi:hypothetical protein